MSWTLLIFAAMNGAAALSGATFKPDQWFRDLNKPSWQPPDWVFPIVWSVLYAINAFAGWIVWKRAGLEGPGLWAMGIYVVGLILNASWSYIFFGLKRLDWAKTSAGLLCLAVALQIILFLPINQLAGLILLPYLAWVMVATVLSSSVWRMNPDQSAVH